MTLHRRTFVERSVASLVSATTASPLLAQLGAEPPTPPQPSTWDLTWVNRLTGKHRVVMDVPEIENGYGVWRSTIWANQYQQVLGAQPREMTTVLVLRHNGIALAMKQSFWTKYGVGASHGVKHPLTLEPTRVNPALMTSTNDGLAPEMDAFALPRFIERGGIALACYLAFQDCIERVRKQDNVSAEAARATALAELVPGVILQPSGVFAAIRAQQAGCAYIRAS